MNVAALGPMGVPLVVTAAAVCAVAAGKLILVATHPFRRHSAELWRRGLPLVRAAGHLATVLGLTGTWLSIVASSSAASTEQVISTASLSSVVGLLTYAVSFVLETAMSAVGTGGET